MITVQPKWQSFRKWQSLANKVGSFTLGIPLYNIALPSTLKNSLLDSSFPRVGMALNTESSSAISLFSHFNGFF